MGQTPIDKERAVIRDARHQGKLSTLAAYTKLSGPGWLQSAITLGGGSLAGSLYLGVLAGYDMMWLQPLAMIMGIIMLSAIGYVTLSTGRRPLPLINEEVNPVLGWGWAIATMMANIVWCMPQFALGSAALRQNLLPRMIGKDALPETPGTLIAVALLAVVAGATIWSYERGGRGARLFDTTLKIMVSLIVLCFFGVVIKLTAAPGGINWSSVLAGFTPRLWLLAEPSQSYRPFLEAAGSYSDFWTQRIVSQQRDVMVTAVATAVGINMTFLLPYSLLKRGWDREFRGLAIFDLSIGLFVPFLLATSCVVMASAARFHTQYDQALVDATPLTKDHLLDEKVAPGSIVNNYLGALDARLQQQYGPETTKAWSQEEIAARRGDLPLADRQLAAMLVQRDAFDLAHSLEPLTGREVGQYVFGIGVVAMALSSIIVLMLINGFVVCEMFGRPAAGNLHWVGALMAMAVGMLGPFVYSGQAKFWLAVPTSVFGMMLLPIAYCSFFFLMNNRRVLGDDLPRGGTRVAVNLAMGLAVALATFGAGWSIWSRTQLMFGIQVRWIALGVVGLFAVLALAMSRRGEKSV